MKSDSVLPSLAHPQSIHVCAFKAHMRVSLAQE